MVIGLIACHITDVSRLGTYAVSGCSLAAASPINHWASQDEFDIADLNAAAWWQAALADGNTVDAGPVGGARIDDGPVPVSADQISMVSGGSGIVKDDVRGRIPADGPPVARQWPPGGRRRPGLLDYPE